MFSGDIAYVATIKSQIHRTLALFGHEEPEATRIVIAGGGNIGFYVAKAIEARQPKIKVKVIEPDLKRANLIADELRRSLVLHGSALDQKLLLEAEIQDADLMVTLTNDDQVNMLAGVMAKRLGCKSDLVLINNPDFLDLSKSLGIDAHISPRSVTISRVLQHVRRGRIRAVHSVQKGQAEIMEAEALETSSMVGAPLRDLELPPGLRIGAIYRDGKVIKPNGDVRIKPKDRVVLFATAETVKQVEQMFRVSLEFF
jgi:trk system potassium uptake protein TrkA